MNDAPHKYFVYLRKSMGREDKQVRSIGDQLAEIRELVARGGFDIVETLEERESAMTKGRPVFNSMLDRIEAGEADGIIAWHPDRLARNALDGGRVIDMLDERTLQDLKFCSFWFENTAQGKLMLNLAFGQSKYHSDNMSIGIRRAQKQKVSEGVWSWKAPVGYLNEPKLRTIVVDPYKAPLVKMAFELYATGRYTIAHVREIVNAKGLRGMNGHVMSPSVYQHMLKCPFYYGVFVYKGEMFEGAHEALISKDLFDAVQAAMTRRSKPNTVRLKNYVYRGLFHCGECGRVITMETQKGHNYLRCTKRVNRQCSQRYLREEEMTKQIAAALCSASISDAAADWMIQQLEGEREQGAQDFSDAKRKADKQIDELGRKIDRLTAAYLDDEAFSSAEFRQRKEELVTRKRRLQENLIALQQTDVARFEPLLRFISGSKQLKYTAPTAATGELRAMIENVGSNLKLFNRTLTGEPRGAWQLVVDQGSFAQHTSAPGLSGAPLFGETHRSSNKCTRQESNL